MNNIVKPKRLKIDEDYIKSLDCDGLIRLLRSSICALLVGNMSESVAAKVVNEMKCWIDIYLNRDMIMTIENI